MTRASNPDSLGPGDLVGPWRIEGYIGRGSYGAVFRARRAGHPSSPPVALKVALSSYDPRFVREEVLLGRLRHPSVPQLIDRGWWHAAPGVMHPYLVMELIRGMPLYEWAKAYNPTSRQVLQVVAQVAWALEAVHRADALHRDVRGDNILVEPEGRAVLTDFGSGTWVGAPPITETLMPPNTREYRSPEALRFQWAHLRDREAQYQARPADDLYALGVSAYRLVTGEYPPPGTDPEARTNPYRPPLRRIPPRRLNERVTPELAELIERLMAQDPEARGSGREIGEAAESAQEHSGPAADVPLRGSERPEPQAESVAVPLPVVPVAVSKSPEVEGATVPPHVPVGTEGCSTRVLLAASVVVGLAWLCWMAPETGPAGPEMALAEPPEMSVVPEDGPTGLGDGGVAARVTSQDAPGSVKAISLEMPKKPLPSQRRPPCRRGEVELNGGCWIGLLTLTPPCGDEAYELNGICYWPCLVDRTRVPTTDNPQQ